MHRQVRWWQIDVCCRSGGRHEIPGQVPMNMSHPRTKRIFPGQQEMINLNDRLTPDFNNTPPLLLQDQTMTEDDNRHLTHPYLSPGQE